LNGKLRHRVTDKIEIKIRHIDSFFLGYNLPDNVKK